MYILLHPLSRIMSRFVAGSQYEGNQYWRSSNQTPLTFLMQKWSIGGESVGSEQVYVANRKVAKDPGTTPHIA